MKFQIPKSGEYLCVHKPYFLMTGQILCINNTYMIKLFTLKEHTIHTYGSTYVTGAAKRTKLAQNTLDHKLVNIIRFRVQYLLSVSYEIFLIKFFINSRNLVLLT